jgi:serine/threonine protein kinase
MMQGLNEWVSRMAPDFPTTIFVLLHVVEKLQKLHSLGLCHRDLKPANILWRPQANAWTLMDFGCAATLGALQACLPIIAPDIALGRGGVEHVHSAVATRLTVHFRRVCGANNALCRKYCFPCREFTPTIIGLPGLLGMRANKEETGSRTLQSCNATL